MSLSNFYVPNDTRHLEEPFIGPDRPAKIYRVHDGVIHEFIDLTREVIDLTSDEEEWNPPLLNLNSAEEPWEEMDISPTLPSEVRIDSDEVPHLTFKEVHCLPEDFYYDFEFRLTNELGEVSIYGFDISSGEYCLLY